jgi:Tfp pilus assembly protein PilV
MTGESVKSESGFGLVELLIAMVVMQVALLALVGAFSAGATALGRADKVNTAAILADQQMELYRSMPYDAIGLDTAGAPTTGTYVSDTSVCPSGKTPVCGNSGPVNNQTPNSSTWSCTLASGAGSIATYFSSNGANPCVAHRAVNSTTTPASPDGKSYFVDTYIAWGAAFAQQRPSKQVSVVVRDANTGAELAREVTVFDCSTGTPPGSPPC